MPSVACAGPSQETCQPTRVIEPKMMIHVIALLTMVGAEAAVPDKPLTAIRPSFQGTPRAFAMPFKDVMRLPMVQVRVNGSRPLWFLIDSGFDQSAIDASVAKELRLRVEDARTEASPGGRVKVGTIRRATLGISRLDLLNVTLESVPFRRLEPFMGHPLDGILGNDLFMAVVVQLDWENEVVRLEDPETFRAPQTAVCRSRSPPRPSLTFGSSR